MKSSILFSKTSWGIGTGVYGYVAMARVHRVHVWSERSDER